MRRLIVMTLLLAGMWIGIQAQQYTVFYLKGQVMCTQKGKTTVLTEKQQVSADAVLKLEQGTALILKDDVNYRLPVIKGPFKGTVAKVKKNKNASTLERSKEYFSRIVGKDRNEVKNDAELEIAKGSVRMQPIVNNGQPPVITEIDTDIIEASELIDKIIEELEEDKNNKEPEEE